MTNVKIIRRAYLTRMYEVGIPISVIAQIHGGTEQGVRSTIRKMVERGALAQRPQPQRGR